MLKDKSYTVTNQEAEDKNSDNNPIYLIENYYGIVEKDCLVSIWGAQHDITIRKKAEREASLFSRVIEQSLNEIYVFNSTHTLNMILVKK